MTWRVRTWLAVIVFVVVVPSLCLGGHQEDQPQVTEDEAKAVMTDPEWFSVNKERNPSKRVRKLLEVAAARLHQAQALTTQGHYAEVISLLEHYTTLISYAIAFIDGLPENQRKRQRGAYKEFDVRVRQQIPTLTELRRNFPTENPVIENALFTAQRLRIIALNGFSGAEIIKVPEEKPQ